jgi:hypothetical protein
MAGLLRRFVATINDRQQRDSVFIRRVVGGAFIIGLLLLGLAFPIMI